MYGSKFADAWRTTTPTVLVRVWAQGLTGFTPREVKTGLEACRTLKWPPTLPEFLMLCRPPVDHEGAYLEAVEQLRLREHGKDEWTSAAIYHATRGMGHELQTKPYIAVRAQWTRELDRAIKRVEAGHLPRDVPPVPLAIEHVHVPTPAPEGVRERLGAWIARITTPTPAKEDHDAATGL